MTRLQWLLLGATVASALSIDRGKISQQTTKRTDPMLFGGSRSNGTESGLARRTDPTLSLEDYGVNWDGESRREWLQDAFPDVYLLANTAIEKFNSRIFNNWFLPGDEEKVKNVLGAVFVNIDFPLGPLSSLFGGSPALAGFLIDPTDFLNLCSNDEEIAGVDAYTKNTKNGDNWEARAHFCPQAFGLNSDSEQVPLLSDIACSRFKFTDTGRYRITNEMESIAATILHEFMHFNSFGKFANDVADSSGSFISDVDGPNGAPQLGSGEPWFAWDARATDQCKDNKCLNNADNYVWFALETYWNSKCSSELRDQDFQFDPPSEPDLSGLIGSPLPGIPF